VVDPDDEGEILGTSEIFLLTVNAESKKPQGFRAINAVLNKITNRYAEEIASNFKGHSL